MSVFSDNLKKFIEKMIHRNTVKALPRPESEKRFSEICQSGVVNRMLADVKKDINIQSYRLKFENLLESNKVYYNAKLESKVTKEQALDLAKDFYQNYLPNFSSKVNGIIDGNNKKIKFVMEDYVDGQAKDSSLNNFNEVYIARRGDLRDVYSIVHEISHSFDLSNGDTEERKIYGEVVPQCIERMLDIYLYNLTDLQLQNYNFNRKDLNKDIKIRNITTVLDRLQIAECLCSKKYQYNDNLRFLRYVVAQMYSTQFMKISPNRREQEIIDFAKNIEQNEMSKLNNSFGTNLSDFFGQKQIFKDVVDVLKNNYNSILQSEVADTIVEEFKKKQDVTVKLGNQEINLIYSGKIPFLLITPSNNMQNKTLVLETNNCEYGNDEEFILQALGTAKDLNDCFNAEQPIVVPILPGTSSNEEYYQQLSSKSLKKNRVDEDVINVIEQAKQILNNKYNIITKEKIFLKGYSSSGIFAQRFAFIHPEIIDTACIGGASGSIPVLSDEFEYPLGIKNFNNYFGKDFNYNAYKEISFDYYVGEYEAETEQKDKNGQIYAMHDMSNFEKSVNYNLGKQYRAKYGEAMMQRANNIVDELKKSGIKIKYSELPGIAHNDSEATEIMKNNSNIKNLKGIRSIEKNIIKSSFERMMKRQKTFETEVTK